MKYDKKAGLLACALLMPFAATAQQADTKAIFNKYDLNHDGYHDANEYLKAVEDSFKEWDSNRDGVVMLGEMGAVAQLPASATPQVRQSLLRWCDFDLDAKCTLGEVKRHSREQLLPIVDQNGDGRLSEEEAMRFYDRSQGGAVGR